jgi:hypothetical protein
MFSRTVSRRCINCRVYERQLRTQNKQRFRQFVLSDSDQPNITTEVPFPTWGARRGPGCAGVRQGFLFVSSDCMWVHASLIPLLCCSRASVTVRPLPTANGTDIVERHLQRRIHQCNMALRHSGNLTLNFHFIPEFMKGVLYKYRTRCIYYTSCIRFISSIWKSCTYTCFIINMEHAVYMAYIRCFINMEHWFNGKHPAAYNSIDENSQTQHIFDWRLNIFPQCGIRCIYRLHAFCFTNTEHPV